MQTESGPWARARERVPLQLKTRGTPMAARLAGRLEVTRVEVRQHLAAREAPKEEELDRTDERGPARRRRPTPRAAARFSNTHAGRAA